MYGVKQPWPTSGRQSARPGGGSDKITCDSNLLSRHRFFKLVCMEDWSSSGQLNVVCFAFVLYALVINKNQLSYKLLYPTIPHLSSSPSIIL